MRNATIVLCLIVVICLFSTLLGGCNSEVSETVANTDAPKLKKYNLDVLTAGITPPDNEIVMKEISKVSEKELSINLNVLYTPWSNYIDKVNLRAASGDKFDIFLCFLGELQGAISRKQVVPLDEYLDRNGTDLRRVINKSDWEDVIISDKTYGVPSVYASIALPALIYRQDLAEKYNIGKLDTLQDIENYLDVITKNEKGMVGYAAGMDIGYAMVRAIYFGNGFPDVPIISYGGSWTRYVKIDLSKKPYKAVNYFKEPEVKVQAQWATKAYEKGWLEKDILIDKDCKMPFKAGKAAMIPGDLYNLPDIISTLKMNVPDAKVQLFIPYSEKNNYKTGPSTNNIACVSSTSQDPDRAVMFLNWLRKSQDNYDLFMLGIKGKHWNPIGTDKAELIGVTEMSNRPYEPTPWWTKQMTYDRTLTTDQPAYVDALNAWKNMKYTASPVVGFTVDNKNFKTEQVQLETVLQEKYAPVINGVVVGNTDLDDALDAIDKAGIDVVVADVQKQLDDWLKKNN